MIANTLTYAAASLLQSLLSPDLLHSSRLTLVPLLRRLRCKSIHCMIVVLSLLLLHPIYILTPFLLLFRTYGNLTCEPYYAGGDCQPILGLYPSVVTNFSRSDQIYAKRVVDRIILTLYEFRASDECIHNAIPLLCRYSFPTCDPAYNIPVYQPVCQRDCEIVRDFLCKEPWQRMVQLINILNLSVIDQPNCGPLKYVNAGAAPMCISTLDGG